MARYDWKVEPRDDDWSDDTYAYFLIHINLKRMAEYLTKEFKKDWWFKVDYGQDNCYIVAENHNFPVRLFFTFDEGGWADIIRHYTDGASYTDDHLGSWHFAKYDVDYSYKVISSNIEDYFFKFEESKKTIKRSLKESKESNLIEKVATKLKDEKIINGTIDTFRGADWFAISGKVSTIKVIYMRGELSIELYQDGKFCDGELEKASSLSDDDFSVNYVIDFIKNFLKVTNFNKNEFYIKESLKEFNYDLINDDLLAMCKGSTKQLIYAMDDYQSNYSNKSLKELKRRIEEVEDLCNKILYQINKR